MTLHEVRECLDRKTDCFPSWILHCLRYERTVQRRRWHRKCHWWYVEFIVISYCALKTLLYPIVSWRSYLWKSCQTSITACPTSPLEFFKVCFIFWKRPFFYKRWILQIYGSFKKSKVKNRTKAGRKNWWAETNVRLTEDISTDTTKVIFFCYEAQGFLSHHCCGVGKIIRIQWERIWLRNHGNVGHLEKILFNNFHVLVL